MADFPHMNYKVFVDSTNIRNGYLSTQASENLSVNTLKKETDDIFNRLQIITAKEGTQWEAFVTYEPGEIIWYYTVPFRAKRTNYNVIPVSGDDWEIVNRADYTNEIDPSSYIRFDNSQSYPVQHDYNPASKKYVDDSFTDFSLNGNFLALDRVLPFTPNAHYQPATKKYVDDSITNLEVSSTLVVNRALHADALKNIPAERFFSANFVYGYNGITVNGNSTDWIRSTSNGFLPFDQTESSDLGSSQWKFNQLYVNISNTSLVNTDNVSSKNIINSQKISTNIIETNNIDVDMACLSEKYIADSDYDLGTVLGIGGTNEVTSYNPGLKLAGVVTNNTGINMNKDAQGLYIALKGRAIVHINGSANQGDYINAQGNGKGAASNTKDETTIGVCLIAGSDYVQVKI